MGVMGCFRNNCESIMCDRYSSEHGYLCNDCFEELVSLGAEANIADFMNTRPKGERGKEAAEARFAVEFPSRYEETSNDR